MKSASLTVKSPQPEAPAFARRATAGLGGGSVIPLRRLLCRITYGYLWDF